jgi:NTE family protein
MVDEIPNDQQENKKPYVILALQGGGAQGAFQAGAYQALNENGYEPDWVAGISIGSINAAIIAGNEQRDRLCRLLEFWNIVAGNLDWWECVPNYSEKLTNLWKVWLSMAGGVSGFFQPNMIPAPFAPRNSPQACSLYNVQKLKTTLQRLINFDFLRDYKSPTHVRLSLGATKVLGAVPETFESFGGPKPGDASCQYAVITIDHILASGANAPWFPGVVINNRLYWDGGMTSNTSVRHITNHLPEIGAEIGNRPVVIFVINLWGTYDREPKTFDEVCWRVKQIQYSSRVDQDVTNGKDFLERARLEKQTRIPSSRNAAESTSPIDIVTVTYHCDPSDIPYGDGLFSRTEIERRIGDGYAAMLGVFAEEPLPWHLRGRDDREVKLHYF